MVRTFWFYKLLLLINFNKISFKYSFVNADKKSTKGEYKMKYKFVAIDCDNTLLNSEGHIPEENKKTIQYLKSKGIEFVIATGRAR